MPDVIVNSTVKKKANEVKELVDVVGANLGKKTDTASIATTSSVFSWIKQIWSYVSNINTYTARGAIRSIQRGVYTSSSSANVTIMISSVTTGKCMVILNSAYTSYGYGTYYSHLVSMTATSITIGSHYSFSPAYYPVSWQVIEFY